MLVRTKRNSNDPFNIEPLRPFSRSERKWKGETGGWGPINFVSSFIDGSVVYGEGDRLRALRTFQGGLMKTMEGRRFSGLTRNVERLENDPNNSSAMGLSGDVRSSEHPNLESLHVVFVKEHNSIAEELSRIYKNSTEWDDERIFETARLINAAQMQKIVHEEFLPAFLGRDLPGLPRYTGYKHWIDPTVSLEFASAAFRIGHSMIADDITKLPRGFGPAQKIPLRKLFFSHKNLLDTPMEEFLRGMCRTKAQEVDLEVVDTLRNFLFENIKEIAGTDLAAINIQRGRDHALPHYNEVRKLFGLQPYKSFDQITKKNETSSLLKEMYKNDINSIDLFVGCLAEDHVPGSALGELTRRIWIEEFARNRDGDRFFYRRRRLFPRRLRWSMKRVRWLRRRWRWRSTLRSIILRNSEIRPWELPHNLFIAR